MDSLSESLDPSDQNPMHPNIESVVLIRHSDKDGEVLSETGKKRALEMGGTELAEILDSTPADALVLLMGVSHSPRTRETLELVAQGLHTAHPETPFITPADLQDKDGGENSIRARITRANEAIASHPGERVVVAVPLALKGMNSAALLHQGGDHSYEDWLDTEPRLQSGGEPDLDKQFFDEFVPNGPQGEHANAALDANELGRRVQESVERLIKASDRYISPKNSDRPRIVVFVGHSWGIDAAIARTVSGGDISPRGVAFLGEKLIGPAEAAQIMYSDSRPHDVHYRDRATNVPTRDQSSD